MRGSVRPLVLCVSAEGRPKTLISGKYGKNDSKAGRPSMRVDQLAVLVVGGIEVAVLAEVVAGALDDADLGLGHAPARFEPERDRDRAEHHQREQRDAQPRGASQIAADRARRRRSAHSA